MHPHTSGRKSHARLKKEMVMALSVILFPFWSNYENKMILSDCVLLHRKTRRKEASLKLIFGTSLIRRGMGTMSIKMCKHLWYSLVPVLHFN